MRRARAERLQIHITQRMVHATHDLVLRQAQVHRPERHLSRDGRGDDLVIRVLEHDARALAQLFALFSADRFAVQQYFAALGREYAVQAQEKRGLACPVRAEHRDALPGADIERNAVQGVSLPVIGKIQVLGLQNRLFQWFSPPFYAVHTRSSTSAAQNTAIHITCEARHGLSSSKKHRPPS